jgi:hypothetical protein
MLVPNECFETFLDVFGRRLHISSPRVFVYIASRLLDTITVSCTSTLLKHRPEYSPNDILALSSFQTNT